MAGNVIGGKAAAKTNMERFGEDFYSRIGASGGRNGTGHTFGHGKVSPTEIGSRGGRVSKRGHKYLYTKGSYNYYTLKATGETVKYKRED